LNNKPEKIFPFAKRFFPVKTSFFELTQPDGLRKEQFDFFVFRHAAGGESFLPRTQSFVKLSTVKQAALLQSWSIR
jgi:hypothetical protein